MLLNNIELDSSIEWRQLENINQVTLLDQGVLSNSFDLTVGTGVNQVNKAFFAASGISGNNRFDLFDMSRTMFGYSLSNNLSGDRIKIFYIKNGSENNLFICGTGNSGVTNIFGWSYLGQYIYPSGHAIYYDVVDGFEVNTGERYFYLSGNGNYELGIFSVGNTG